MTSHYFWFTEYLFHKNEISSQKVFKINRRIFSQILMLIKTLIKVKNY